MWGRLRKAVRPERPPRPRNLNPLEAAALYVVACVENDQDRIDDALSRVSPDGLTYGVQELAQRAVLALAAERGASPEAVARALLGLPPAAASRS